MTRKEVFRIYKNQQKDRAKKIHELKSQKVYLQRENKDVYQILWDISVLKKHFRYYHLALCMLRGKTYKQIESKCSWNNYPDMEQVRSIMSGILAEITSENVENVA